MIQRKMMVHSIYYHMIAIIHTLEFLEKDNKKGKKVYVTKSKKLLIYYCKQRE